MQTNSGASTGAVQRAVDEINLPRPFIQPDLKVKGCASGEIGRSPFNIEGAVRTDAGYRREDAAVGSVGSQIIPMRTNQIVHRCSRQTGIGKCGVGAGELQVTVRAYVGGSECSSVEVERKWKSNGCRGVVSVIAGVDRARNDLSRRCGKCVTATWWC